MEISAETPPVRVIYFDNAATSWPKPPGVARAMKEFIEVLRGKVSLRKALERTVATGAINQSAQASVEDVLTQVFVPTVTN